MWSSYYFPSKAARVLGEMADSRSRAGNVKDDLGSLEPGSEKSNNISCQKYSGANVKRLPVAKDVVI